MFDYETLHARISIISENLKHLSKLSKLTYEDFLNDMKSQAAAMHWLQTGIEAMLDIGTHILSRHRNGTPHTYAGIMKKLAEVGVISRENVDSYLKMARYRNRLVHVYHEVSGEELYKIIQDRLSDFELYIKEITEYLEKQK